MRASVASGAIKHRIARAAVLRMSERTCSWSSSDDEVGSCQRAIRARDVRAADLQEEPTKPAENRAVLVDVVSSDRTKTAAPRRTSQRPERAIGHASVSERDNQTRARATETLSLPPLPLAQSTRATANVSGSEFGVLRSAMSDWSAVASDA